MLRCEDVSDEVSRLELIDTLERICECGQSSFANPLIIQYFKPEHEPFRMPGDHPFFYIAESGTVTKYWFWFIPRRIPWVRNVFAIHPGFYGAVRGKKEIRCGVFDRRLLDIVEKEIAGYARTFHATAIDLTKDFTP